MALVSASDWEAKIDANVSTSFYVPQSVNQCPNSSCNVTFCNAINMRGQNSKISASIRSCNVYYEPFSALNIDKTSFSKREEVESALKSVLKTK